MKIIAHRGYSGKYPENTLIAIKKAIALKAKMIEIDVHESKDNEIIVIHDETLDRTCDKSGKIKDLTAEEIRECSAGLKFDEQFAEEKVPLLSEVLELVASSDYSCDLNIEIKDDKSGYMIETILSLVDKFKLRERVLISSFNHKLLKKFNLKAPDIKIGVLIKSNIYNLSDYLKSFDMNIYSLNRHTSFVDLEDIESLNKMGIKTYVFTVNDLDFARELDSIGVAGIFTDEYEKFEREY